MNLPQDVLRQLTRMQEVLVAPGDIFFLPPDRVLTARDTDPHAHPCLVAAVDLGRAFLVIGTSSHASGPALVVEVGETDLDRRTEFDFRATFVVPLAELVAEGSPMGRLAAARIPEILTAAAASNNVAVRRLTKLVHS